MSDCRGLNLAVYFGFKVARHTVSKTPGGNYLPVSF
jgi:hypothetical protein